MRDISSTAQLQNRYGFQRHFETLAVTSFSQQISCEIQERIWRTENWAKNGFMCDISSTAQLQNRYGFQRHFETPAVTSFSQQISCEIQERIWRKENWAKNGFMCDISSTAQLQNRYGFQRHFETPAVTSFSQQISCDIIEMQERIWRTWRTKTGEQEKESNVFTLNVTAKCVKLL